MLVIDAPVDDAHHDFGATLGDVSGRTYCSSDVRGKAIEAGVGTVANVGRRNPNAAAKATKWLQPCRDIAVRNTIGITRRKMSQRAIACFTSSHPLVENTFDAALCYRAFAGCAGGRALSCPPEALLTSWRSSTDWPTGFPAATSSSRKFAIRMLGSPVRL